MNIDVNSRCLRLQQDMGIIKTGIETDSCFQHRAAGIWNSGWNILCVLPEKDGWKAVKIFNRCETMNQTMIRGNEDYLEWIDSLSEKYRQSQIKAAVSVNSDIPQVGEQLYQIPWGHIKLLIDRCDNDCQKAVYFLNKTVENNWSRAVLLNFLDTDLYERQGKAISNFETSLPARYGALAQELTKDPFLI